MSYSSHTPTPGLADIISRRLHASIALKTYSAEQYIISLLEHSSFNFIKLKAVSYYVDDAIHMHKALAYYKSQEGAKTRYT